MEKTLSWISTKSVSMACSISCCCIWFDELLKTKCQRQWLFSHQDQAPLSSPGFGPAYTDFVSVRLSRLRAAILTKVIFKGAFTQMAVGEEEAAAPTAAPPFCYWEMGVVGLELELHNGRLSELIKQKMFHPLCVGKHGHKWGLYAFMPFWAGLRQEWWTLCRCVYMRVHHSSHECNADVNCIPFKKKLSCTFRDNQKKEFLVLVHDVRCCTILSKKMADNSTCWVKWLSEQGRDFRHCVQLLYAKIENLIPPTATNYFFISVCLCTLN